MWWSFAITAFISLNLAFYPSFRDQSEQLEQAFSQIPDSAMALFSDTNEFLSPVGYLSSQVYYLMLPMLLGILAISLGSSLLAREEKEQTIELLLSRPVSRSALLTAKIMSGIVIILIASTVSGIVTLILAKLVKLDVDLINIALATLASMLLAVSFGSLAFLITSFGKARIASIGLATVYGLGGYIIASLVDVANWLKWPAKLFPFNYYKPAEILLGNYNWANILFIICVSLLCIATSYIIFRRRDIA
jgi:ABC-2 type transport system permease protein